MDTKKKNNSSSSSSSNNQRIKTALTKKLSSLILSDDGVLSLWTKYLGVTQTLYVLDQLENTPLKKISLSKQIKQKNLSNERKENIKYFIDWLKDNNVDVSGIEICEFEGYDLGLKATKDFKTNELLLNIPRKLILTTDSAYVSKYGKFFSKNISDQFIPHTVLALHILLIKYTGDPFWKPYIDVLPSEFNTILYFTTDEMNLLKGSPAFNPSLQFCINIASQYIYLCNFFEKNDDPMSSIMAKSFTYNDFRWAVSTIMTRLNSIPLEADPELKVNALIPLWDMCNHCSGEITTNFDVEKNQLECFALTDYKKDDQIFIFYGVRPNRFFFQYNGFVHMDNENDSYPVTLGISPYDPLHEDKFELLLKLGLDRKQECMLEKKENPISSHLLAFARVFVMNKEELTYWLSGNNHQDLLAEEIPDNPGFSDLTKRAYSFINTRCTLLKGAYKNIDSICVTDKDETNGKAPPSRTEEHCKLIKSLKQCELNLLQKAIDYTAEKM